MMDTRTMWDNTGVPIEGVPHGTVRPVTYNRANVEATIERIKQVGLDHVWMSTWVAQTSSCQTVACFAGWAFIAAHPEIPTTHVEVDQNTPESRAVERILQAECGRASFADWAQAHLGLNTRALFIWGSWPSFARQFSNEGEGLLVLLAALLDDQIVGVYDLHDSYLPGWYLYHRDELPDWALS